VARAGHFREAAVRVFGRRPERRRRAKAGLPGRRRNEGASGTAHADVGRGAYPPPGVLDNEIEVVSDPGAGRVIGAVNWRFLCLCVRRITDGGRCRATRKTPSPSPCLLPRLYINSKYKHSECESAEFSLGHWDSLELEPRLKCAESIIYNIFWIPFWCFDPELLPIYKRATRHLVWDLASEETRPPEPLPPPP
jgi:hypothetical protein